MKQRFIFQYVILLGLLLSLGVSSVCGLVNRVQTHAVNTSSQVNDILIVGAPGVGSGTIGLLSPTTNIATSANYVYSGVKATIGITPQGVSLFGGDLYIVQSGSSSLLVLDPATRTVKREMSLGSGNNPYEVGLLSATKGYVTNLVAHTVSVINPANSTSTTCVTSTILLPTGNALAPFSSSNPSVAGPQGIAVDNSKVYVALTNLDPSYQPGGPGLVVVINSMTNTIEKTVTLSYTNPQVVYKHPSYPNKLFVVETGSYSDGRGVLEIIDTLTDQIVARLTVIGEPTSVAMGPNGKGYLVDSSGVVLIPFTLTGTTLAALAPIQVNSTGWASEASVDSTGKIYVADRLQDKLFILDSNGTVLESYTVNSSPSVIVLQ